VTVVGHVAVLPVILVLLSGPIIAGIYLATRMSKPR